MLLGSEIGAALTALEPLGIDLIGLNCATGPAEMSEHLRYLSRHARVGLSCMPNAGLPSSPRRRALPADARGARRRPRRLHPGLRAHPGRRLLRDDAGAPPRRSSSGSGPWAGHPQAAPRAGRRIALPARAASGRTRRTCPSASAPTPTAPRRSARRCSPRTGTTASRSRATRPATAPTCSTSASTTSAVTACRHARDRRRFATASTLPLMLDSTEPAVIEAGLERSAGGVVNSVNSRTATARTHASPG